MLLYEKWSGGYASHVFGAPGKYNLGLPGFYEKRADGGFVPPPAQLDALKQRSLDTMLPLIKSELSVLNSLYELKDFSSLPRTLAGMGGIVDKALLYQKKAFKVGSTLRELLTSSADGYLQLKFNLQPLLSDISGVYTALSRFERQLNNLIARQGRVQTKHFSYVWNEFEPFSTSKSNPYGVSLPPVYQDELTGGAGIISAIEATRNVYTEPTVFHAEIEYNYNYTQYQVEHARILGLLDAFGINLDPRIIWNAIPWSFVVDWVVGVNRWLSQFRYTNMEPLINIHRYLWSVRRYRRIDVSCKSVQVGPAPDNPKRIPHVQMPQVVESSYRRQVGLPSISSIQSSGLNLNEFSLGAALVLARRRRPKHRVM